MTTVNTNAGALLAQKFLRANAADMVTTQNRVSSGLRVSSVTDDASSFAVASGLRGDIKSYTAATAALQGSTVAATIAISAGERISGRLGDMKAKMLQLADESLSTAARAAYNVDLNSMLQEINGYFSQASYNGSNLLGSGGSDLRVVANIDGSALTIRNNDATVIVDPGAALSIKTNTEAQIGLSVVGAIRTSVEAALSNLGADLKRVTAQTEFIRQTEETTRIALGAMVDADLVKESATLSSLQVRQQLGVQAMGIANSAPQALLGLFR